MMPTVSVASFTASSSSLGAPGAVAVARSMTGMRELMAGPFARLLGMACPGRTGGRLGPPGDRALLRHAVDHDVRLLVVERKQVLDLRRLGYGRGVAPHDVLVQLTADPYRPVDGLTLVRAAGAPRTRLEQVEPHVELWQVVTDREGGLEQQTSPQALRPQHTADHALHVPRRGE